MSNSVLWSHRIYLVLSTPITKVNIKVNLHKRLYIQLYIISAPLSFATLFKVSPLKSSSVSLLCCYYTTSIHFAELCNVRVRVEFSSLSTKGENVSAFKSLTLLGEKMSCLLLYTFFSFLTTNTWVDICKPPIFKVWK